MRLTRSLLFGLLALTGFLLLSGCGGAELGVGGGVLGLVHLILQVYAIVKTISSRATTGMKVLWVVIVLFLPIVGLILWFFIGPR